MKRLLAAVIVLAASCTTPTLAGSPTYDWAGFYAGGNVGYGWEHSFWDNSPLNNSAINLPGITKSNGVLGGGQVGYNVTFGNVLLGVEGTWQWTNLDGTTRSIHDPTTDRYGTHVKDLWTAAARFGFVQNNWLLYAKGGYAGANIGVNYVSTNGPDKGTANGNFDGWVIGGGAETKLGNNWIAGLEYNYIDLGHKTLQGPGLVGTPFAIKDDILIRTALFRLSYLFATH